MTQITIPDIPSEIQYDVNSSNSGPFTVPFPFFIQADVKARVTDAAGVVTELTHITDFVFTVLTVPIGQEGSGYEGGSITLNTPIGADGDTELLIYRDQQPQRTANYPNSGPFSMPILNDEQNSFIMVMQQFFANAWQFLAGTTARASINIPEGVAPTKPADGDVWLTATDFLARVNGVSYSLIASAGSGSGDVVKVGTPNPNEIGVWTGDGTIQGLGALEFNGYGIKIENGLPYVSFLEDDASADEGHWRFGANSDSFYLSLINDIGSSSINALNIHRTGVNPDYLHLQMGLLTNASVAARAGFQIPEGIAPTAPSDGDIWVTAAGEFMARLNGVTVDLSAASGGDVVQSGSPATQQVAFWDGGVNLAGDSAWTFDAVSNNVFLTAGSYYLYDNVEIRIGTGEDMVIVSDGLDVTMTLGALTDFLLQGGSSQTDKIIEYTLDGALDFYYNALIRLQMGSTGVWNHVPVFIKEQAAAAANTAGWAQLWIRNDAPSSLVYNDDTGLDHDLTGPDAARVQRKTKAVIETVVNNTPQADDDLAGFVLWTGKRYRFEVFLKVEAASDIPDFVVNLGFTSLPLEGMKDLHYNYAGTVGANSTASIEGGQFAQINSLGENVVKVTGFFRANVTTAGTMGLVWAQSTTHASNTSVLPGSYMTVEMLD